MLLASQVVASNSVVLDYRYFPSTVYRVSEQTLSEMGVSFDGDPKNLPDQLRSQLPSLFKVMQNRAQSITTGGVDERGGYSISLMLDSNKTHISSGGSEFRQRPSGDNLPEGSVITGRVSEDGSVTSLPIEGVPDKAALPQDQAALFQALFSELTNPPFADGRTLSVGDSASHTIPISLPVSAVADVTATLRITHTLAEINGDTSTFDLGFDVLSNRALTDNGITVTSSGSGVMVYDSRRRISPTRNSTMSITISLPYHGGVLKVISSTTSSSSVTDSPTTD